MYERPSRVGQDSKVNDKWVIKKRAGSYDGQGLCKKSHWKDIRSKLILILKRNRGRFL